MNFRKAWLALTDRLEPVVVVKEKHILGSPQLVDLYAVTVPDTNGEKYVQMDGHVLWQRWQDHYYTTCEQAHASADGKPVRVVRAILVGDSYLRADELKEITIQPKPKVAKGRK